jgi:hypothetical protein
LAVLERRLALETDEAEVLILVRYGHFRLPPVLERRHALQTDQAEVLILVRYEYQPLSGSCGTEASS